MARFFITENEIAWLPADNTLAFLRFEQICRDRLNDMFASMGRDDYDYGIKSEYITIISAAIEAYEIKNIDLKIPGSTEQRFEQFYDQVTREAMRLRLTSRMANVSQSVEINIPDKARIKNLISKLREAIAKADIPERQRKSALSKLDHLESELEKPRLNFAVIAAAIAAASVSLHQSQQVIIDAPKTIDSIMQLVGKSKVFEEEQHPEVCLPPPPLQLSPPNESNQSNQQIV